jgi:hypothetical protein
MIHWHSWSFCLCAFVRYIYNSHIKRKCLCGIFCLLILQKKIFWTCSHMAEKGFMLKHADICTDSAWSLDRRTCSFKAHVKAFPQNTAAAAIVSFTVKPLVTKWFQMHWKQCQTKFWRYKLSSSQDYWIQELSAFCVTKWVPVTQCCCCCTWRFNEYHEAEFLVHVFTLHSEIFLFSADHPNIPALNISVWHFMALLLSIISINFYRNE